MEKTPTPPLKHKCDLVEFSQIVIKKIVKSKFVAEFFFKYPGSTIEIETSIHSDSVQGCIKRVNTFLSTELTPEQVTVKM